MPYSNYGKESKVVYLPGSHSDVEEFQLLLQTISTDVISTLTAGWPKIPDRVECVCCRREDCADLSPTCRPFYSFVAQRSGIYTLAFLDSAHA